MGLCKCENFYVHLHQAKHPIMHFYKKTLLIALTLAILFSCHRGGDKALLTKLSTWDSMLDKDPQAVSDSLQTIDTDKLSRSNRAYYNLLKVISDDKTYYDFTDDSLIQKVVNYYQQHDPESDHYVRALIYQGIVRTRMGITDSTVFEPLKKAENIFNTKKEHNNDIGYVLNYFLGEIQYNNYNYDSANNKYQNALRYAKLKNDTTHIFDAYLAIFWNKMAQVDFIESKLYLDSIKLISDDENDYMLNAASIYYEYSGDIHKALNYDKRQLQLLNNNENTTDIASLYYTISKKYSKLNLLDSALIYGEMAIEWIKNENRTENYLFYDNLADIAEKQEDYASANIYKNKSLDSYKESVLDRLDTQIIELEKKYDLTKSENLVLKSKQNILMITVIFLFIALSLTGLLLFNIKRRRLEAVRLIKLEHENERHAMEAQMLKEEASKMNWLISLYSYISNRLTSLQDNFGLLSQRYISSNPKIHEEMSKILYSAETDLREMPKILIPDDETFSLYTGLNKEESEYFNNSEKIFLMLLACKANNKQIATFMNAPLQSIRARKSQLKKKVIEKGLKEQFFFEI